MKGKQVKMKRRKMEEVRWRLRNRKNRKTR